MTLLLVELEKLRTVRSAWLLFASGVLVPLPIAIVALSLSGDISSAPQDLIDLVALTAMFAAALAAVACAREFEHHTISVAFMVEPRRERVIAAKAAAACILGLAMATLSCVLTLGTAAVWISADGGTWPWTGAQTFQAIGGAIALTGAIAVAGTGFGGVVRHVGGAITLLVVVYFVLEGTLTSLFTFWHDYGFTQASDALVEPGVAHTYAFSTAMLVVIGSSLIVLAAGIAVVRRADV